MTTRRKRKIGEVRNCRSARVVKIEGDKHKIHKNSKKMILTKRKMTRMQMMKAIPMI
jgi:hypothetical protein